uniref:(northern house mosquito) hypothetical protein n=1 Tax=Culex pipiens TaxID=7175 RepID=A0A8D7ZZ57_CULPI
MAARTGFSRTWTAEQQPAIWPTFPDEVSKEFSLQSNSPPFGRLTRLWPARRTICRVAAQYPPFVHHARTWPTRRTICREACCRAKRTKNVEEEEKNGEEDEQYDLNEAES